MFVVLTAKVAETVLLALVSSMQKIPLAAYILFFFGEKILLARGLLMIIKSLFCNILSNIH